MEERLWTVVRFPNGSWSYGGKPTNPDYFECEIWQIQASSPEKAVKKAQAKRARDRKKSRRSEGETGMATVCVSWLSSRGYPMAIANSPAEARMLWKKRWSDEFDVEGKPVRFLPRYTRTVEAPESWMLSGSDPIAPTALELKLAVERGRVYEYILNIG